MHRHDVIIVGSGPGGGMAAYELARAGFDVLVLEKEILPRYKPCGGGLSLKVERLLPFSIQPVVEELIFGSRLTCRGKGEAVLRSHEPVAYMVMRSRFDHFLAKMAQGAGARLLEGGAVLSIRPEAEGYEVEIPEGRFACRFLVGADGVHSRVRKTLFSPWKGGLAAAVEWEISAEPEVVRSMGGCIHVDFGEVPQGYAWVFPKTCGLSVGVGGFMGALKSPKTRLLSYVRREPLLQDVPIRENQWVGYPIPTNPSRGPLVRGRALLVGDAAGLVDPFFGEGIYYALRSGQLAAETVGAALTSRTADLYAYDQKISRELYPEFRAARKLGNLVYGAPGLFCRIVGDNPDLGLLYFKALGDTRGYQKFWRELKRRSFSVLWHSLKKRTWETVFKSSGS